jgi:hypothetical protein
MFGVVAGNNGSPTKESRQGETILLGVVEHGELDNVIYNVPGRPRKFSNEYGKTTPRKGRIIKRLMGVGLLHSTNENCESRRRKGDSISLT